MLPTTTTHMDAVRCCADGCTDVLNTPLICYTSVVRFLQAPLVGNAAPEFSATAVFDQEFVDINLSQYKVGDCGFFQ